MNELTVLSQLELVEKEFSGARTYASEYEGNTPIAHFFNTRLKRVGELLVTFRGGLVLDLGCGPAKIGHVFQGRPVDYHGVDISAEMVSECKRAFRHNPRFQFSVGRIDKLKFTDGCCDVVLCLGAFEYLLDPAAAIKEFARVAKVDGLVIVTMHNSLSPYRLWLRYGALRIRNALPKLARLMGLRRFTQEAGTAPLFNVHSEKTFRGLFAVGGLTVEDVVYYDFNVFLTPLDSLFPALSTYVSRRLERLCRGPFRRLGTGFIVMGRKRAQRQSQV
jgi:ubiquinone/menaquinone biosynthesis C-methylase UbiE